MPLLAVVTGIVLREIQATTASSGELRGKSALLGVVVGVDNWLTDTTPSSGTPSVDRAVESGAVQLVSVKN